MPSLVTHQLFAYEALNACGDETLISIINRYPEAFSIGSSGPDILLFYHFWPFHQTKKSRAINELGNSLHKTHINKVFERALIRTKEDIRYREETISYLAGWLCHYALDRIAHPFVFYWSGFGSEQSNYHHRRMEAMIDALMMQRKLGKDISTYRPADVVRRLPTTHKAIANLYIPIVQDVFHIGLQEQDILRSIKDMRLLYQVLHDPYGWKFSLLQKLETKPYSFTGTLIKRKFKDQDESYDVLNLSHQTWLHPCDDSFTSQASFPELYDQAIQEGKIFLHLLGKYLFQQGSLDAIIALIGNRTYDTGLLNTIKMKHANDKYSI